jgi:hypothetical protein
MRGTHCQGSNHSYYVIEAPCHSHFYPVIPGETRNLACPASPPLLKVSPYRSLQRKRESSCCSPPRLMTTVAVPTITGKLKQLLAVATAAVAREAAPDRDAWRPWTAMGC